MLWQIFFPMCLFGTVQHFLYQPLGRPRFLRWLLPVSESPWEHTKLCVWPLGAGLALAAAGLGAELPAFLAAWAFAAGHSMCTMLGIYYLYRCALGVSGPILWVDIGNFFITMLCAWPLGLGRLAQPVGPAAGAMCGLCLLALAEFYQWAAASPPNYPMFREENTNGRDQRTGCS